MVKTMMMMMKRKRKRERKRERERERSGSCRGSPARVSGAASISLVAGFFKFIDTRIRQLFIGRQAFCRQFQLRGAELRGH